MVLQQESPTTYFPITSTSSNSGFVAVAVAVEAEAWSKDAADAADMLGGSGNRPTAPAAKVASPPRLRSSSPNIHINKVGGVAGVRIQENAMRAPSGKEAGR
jgi:hypothetical protein